MVGVIIGTYLVGAWGNPNIMSMSIHQKIVFIVSALAIGVMLCACSDGTQENAAQTDKKTVDTHSTLSEPAVPTKPKAEQTWERPLKIGVIGPETGADSAFGMHVLAGVMAAAKRFNAEGGIGGEDIEVINIDNKGDPSLTNQGVAYLISQGVIAILSAPTGWSTFAPIHRVNGSKTIFISIGSRRRIERSGPYIFRTALPDEMATDELIEYATRELGYANYALVTSSDYSYSLDISSLFKRAVMKYGGAIKVEADTYDSYLAKPDLGAVIDAIKSSPFTLQAVIFTGGADEGALLAKGLKNAGLHLPIIGGEDLFVEDYLRECSDVSGALIYASYSHLNHSPMMDKFIEDVDAKNHDRFVALAYDSFMLLARAIKSAGSTDSAKVRDALIKSGGYEGATGKTSFTSEGMPVKHPFIHGIKVSDDGGAFVLLNHHRGK